MEETKSGRLLSLDALRGFDMFWIIGGGALIQALAGYTGWGWMLSVSDQLEHVEWNGFHFYDLIFPLFLFLSGVTMPFSLTRQIEKGIPKNKVYLHVFRRALLLVIFGIIYNGLGDWNYSHIRFASVLAQIGIAYLFGALIFLNTNWKQQIYCVAGILIGYWGIQMLIPVPEAGAGVLTQSGSINGYFDRLFLPGKLYLDNHDPEGLLVKISATATALLGALTGSFIKNNPISGKRKVLYMAAASVILLTASVIWNLVLPINKNLWTSSFVLHTAGWSVLLLAAFYLVIDVLHFKKWCIFFVVIGMNPITIYMAKSLFKFSNPVEHIFGGFIALADAGFQPVLTTVFMLIIEWLLLYFLYKKKIFLRV